MHSEIVYLKVQYIFETKQWKIKKGKICWVTNQ
jgi:hypothetical protein